MTGCLKLSQHGEEHSNLLEYVSSSIDKQLPLKCSYVTILTLVPQHASGLRTALFLSWREGSSLCCWELRRTNLLAHADLKFNHIIGDVVRVYRGATLILLRLPNYTHTHILIPFYYRKTIRLPSNFGRFWVKGSQKVVTVLNSSSSVSVN